MCGEGELASGDDRKVGWGFKMTRRKGTLFGLQTYISDVFCTSVFCIHVSQVTKIFGRGWGIVKVEVIGSYALIKGIKINNKA